MPFNLLETKLILPYFGENEGKASTGFQWRLLEPTILERTLYSVACSDIQGTFEAQGEGEVKNGQEAAVANGVLNCNCKPQKPGKSESLFEGTLKKAFHRWIWVDSTTE